MVKRYGAGTVWAIAVTVVLWSTTFAGLVAALEHFGAGHLLFLRWTLTALLFFAFAVFTRMRLPRPADLGRIALAGVFGFSLYQMLLVSGQTGVSATMAGFLINMGPVFTTVLAIALGREEARWATWAGLVVCTIGLAVMGLAKGGFGEMGPSAALIVLAALSFALYTIISKPLLARYRPLEVTTYAVIAGALPFVVFSSGSLAALQDAGTSGVLTLVYLAVIPGGVAYVLWARSLKGLGPGVASRFLYLVPVLGTFVSWAWIGEEPHLQTVIGGLVVMAGVMLASGGGLTVPLRAVAPEHIGGGAVVAEAAA